MTAFSLLLGGDLTINDRARALIDGTRVIAADSGMRHAGALGVVPELWVGDFDSTPKTLLQNWANVPRLPYPAQKSVTDGEIAVEEALKRGAKSLVLAGALGGERTDHGLMHLFQALSLLEKGIDTALTSGEEEAYPMLPGKREFDLPAGSLFSVLAFSDLGGLSISNARYPLNSIELMLGSSRTISNVALGPTKITIESGKAIVLARPYDMTGA